MLSAVTESEPRANAIGDLRSALEALGAEVLPDLPDARIEEDFAELQRASERLELECLRRLGEIERRRTFARDGHLSVGAWLADRFRVSHGAARASARTARGLEQMPGTRSGLKEGSITLSAARVLVDAHEQHPAAFCRDEELLLEAARRHSVADLSRAAAFWRARVEAETEANGEPPRKERARTRRNLHASVTFEGMVRLDGDLDPEAGETLLTALGAVIDAEVRSRPSTEPDPRRPAQRRADALGEICRQFLDRPDRSTVAGERPHLVVTVPVEALVDPDGIGELDHVGPIGGELVHRLACDASVRRVVMAGDSQPLDVGRATSVIPPAIRRALIVRDRRCRFPGCERPHAWCDGHHVLPWTEGGPTALWNLVLLCRRHHRCVHERGGFGLAHEDGVPVFRRPDGTVLEDRAPP
jgi:Domain of unknown function (DUF222)